MKKLITLTFIALLSIFSFNCQKVMSGQLTGKDWTITYTNDNNEPEYLIYRFYDDNHLVKFELNRQDDPDAQDIKIDGLGYSVSYTIFTWSWLDDKHTQIHLEYSINGYTILEYTYNVEKLGYSELILRKADQPESLIFDKNNGLLKDSKYEYETFYNNVVNKQ